MKQNSQRMESRYYFITVFGDIDTVIEGTEVAHALESVGNLYPSYEEAVKALGKIKQALKKQ